MSTKRALAILVVIALAVSGIYAEQPNGERLSEEEMASVTGELHIFGISISLRQRRTRRRQTNRYPGAVQCDILAQNKADDLGLDTRNQDNSTTDYNSEMVAQIYDRFPENRHSEPPEGTSGYYFSTSDSENYTKQHMGAYTRSPGSSTYTRYWNDSFTQQVPREAEPAYAPGRITSQVFVPLERRDHTDLYHR